MFHKIIEKSRDPVTSIVGSYLGCSACGYKIHVTLSVCCLSFIVSDNKGVLVLVKNNYKSDIIATCSIDFGWPSKELSN
jgi:hypothetical protein